MLKLLNNFVGVLKLKVYKNLLFSLLSRRYFRSKKIFMFSRNSLRRRIITLIPDIPQNEASK